MRPKIILANEVTTLCHSPEEANAAAEAARRAFDEGETAEGLPSFKAELPIDLLKALRLCVLATSNGEARRLIRGGGAKINDQVISDEAHQITHDDTDSNGKVKISAGKKRHAVLMCT